MLFASSQLLSRHHHLANNIYLGLFNHHHHYFFSFHCYSIQISLQPNCEKIQPLLRQAENDYKLLVLAAAAFGFFGIILIVLAFVLWK
jgi:hypothetical protein